jgi:hypothetical protein
VFLASAAEAEDGDEDLWGDTITTIYQEVWVLSLNESKIYQLPLSRSVGVDVIHGGYLQDSTRVFGMFNEN